METLNAADFMANPTNAGILRYRWLRGGTDTVTVDDLAIEGVDAWSGGGHPDIAERVVELGRSLPSGSLISVGGTFALVHRRSATILSAIVGTAYALRVTGESFDRSVSEGATPLKRWSGGRVTDLAVEAGIDWLWGAWRADEAEWLLHTCRLLDEISA